MQLLSTRTRIQEREAKYWESQYLIPGSRTGDADCQDWSRAPATMITSLPSTRHRADDEEEEAYLRQYLVTCGGLLPSGPAQLASFQHSNWVTTSADVVTLQLNHNRHGLRTYIKLR